MLTMGNADNRPKDNDSPFFNVCLRGSPSGVDDKALVTRCDNEVLINTVYI